MVQTRTRVARVAGVLAAVLLTPGQLRTEPRQAPAQAAQEAAPFDQAAAIAALQAQIAGKEELPATEVFKNITRYKGVSAGRLLRIMDHGFSRGLGVTCTHCHIAGEWDRDDKAAKQTAREMSRMMATINGELLKKIPNLKSTNPAVNCTTCHRGQIRPALELPAGAIREVR